MNASRILIAAGALAGLLAAAQPTLAGHHEGDDADAATAMTDAPNIVAVATAAGSFSTLIAALEATDLTGVLEGEGPFTVLAPTDDAFAALPEGALDGLLADPEKLAEILKLHVVPGRAEAAAVINLAEVTTVQGQALAVVTDDGVSIGGAKVVTPDVAASNGVIHVIDRVILP